MEDDHNSKEASGEQSGEETTSEWKMWYPCPVCHETELNLVTESHLSVSTTKEGTCEQTSSAGEYDYVECSKCNERLYDGTAGSQHL